MKLKRFPSPANILKENGFNNSSLIKNFTFGSWLYGTQNPNSDVDEIFIVDNLNNEHEFHYSDPEVDFHFFTLDKYKEMLDNQEIKAIECYSQEIKNNETPLYEYTVKKDLLRKSFSKKSSNSWVKAKKKMTIPEESSIIGLKSLYHSLRILDFGIQISKYGYIKYLSGEQFTNVLDVKTSNDDKFNWEYWKSNYKNEYNKLKSEFKKLAPK